MLTSFASVFFFYVAGPPGNPEIWWASISEGSVEGGDELGLIGKKFQSGEFFNNCCCWYLFPASLVAFSSAVFALGW